MLSDPTVLIVNKKFINMVGLTSLCQWWKCCCCRHKGSKEVQIVETVYSIGSNEFFKQPMSILLAFGKEDEQFRALQSAAVSFGYQCHSESGGIDALLQKFNTVKPDVVVIDTRTRSRFDPTAMCKCLRESNSGEGQVIIIALTGHSSEMSVLNLLDAGFNRRWVENLDIAECANEMLMIERNDRHRLVHENLLEAFVRALDHVTEAVEVVSPTYRIEYINPAYTQMFGYTKTETANKISRHLQQQTVICTNLQKGLPWNGQITTKTKNGTDVSHIAQFLPVMDKKGFPHHFIGFHTTRDSVSARLITRSDNSESCGPPRRERTQSEISQQMRKSSGETVGRTSKVVGGSNRRRRESIARIHGMPIEGPITKVINIINSIQGSSTPGIAQDLDKVIDILLTSDLFSGAINTDRRPDKMTSDLVEGLMTNVKTMNDQNEKRRMSTIQGPSQQRTSRTSEIMLAHIKEVLDGPSSDNLKFNSLAVMPDNVAKALENEMTWSFDILKLERVTQKRPLVYLGMKILERFGVSKYLQVSTATLRNWLQVIEENYHANNTYHNSTHAADVMQAAAYFLEKDRIKAILEPVDEVATLLAAVVHDLDHPGRTNPYLINSGHRLALLYNDTSVLESHHVALAFTLSRKDPRINIFQNLEKDDHRLIRQYMIDLVLATEMAKHFEHLAKFVSNISKPLQTGRNDMCDFSTKLTGNRISSIRTFSNMPKHTTSLVPGSGSSGEDDDDEEANLRKMSTPENRAIVKRMLIKCCDVSNPSRPLETYKVWTTRIASEYFDQTDEEREHGYPIVMPMFDRKNCDIPKSQISFIEFFLKDMFELWQAFCETPEITQYLHSNLDYWTTQVVKNKEPPPGPP